jgi:hypothetical protein
MMIYARTAFVCSVQKMGDLELDPIGSRSLLVDLSSFEHPCHLSRIPAATGRLLSSIAILSRLLANTIDTSSLCNSLEVSESIATYGSRSRHWKCIRSFPMVHWRDYMTFCYFLRYSSNALNKMRPSSWDDAMCPSIMIRGHRYP